jgi:hypothetical protein
MAAPQWFEGKDSVAGKLFGDDFEAGNVKLTFKSVAANGLNLKVEGTQNGAGTVDGLFETKYTFANGMLDWCLSFIYFLSLLCLKKYPFSLTSPALT